MNTDNTNKIPLYIFDLDGTLALTEHRTHLISGDKKEWDAFFEACDKDEPNVPVIKLLRQLNFSCEVWIFSGRSDLVYGKTIAWLVKHTGLEQPALPRLKMRSQGDYTPDDVLKLKWYTKFLSSDERARLVCIFDDRDKVVKMWRELGVACLQVGYGDF